MDSLPLDTSHPAVRDYLALVRLQVMTPLSLLINIAVLVVCSTLSKPTLREVFLTHPTSISPLPPIIGIYLIVVFASQIGHCLLLVLVKKAETKQTLTKAVGPTLVLANWVMALWAIAFTFDWFLAATILQGIIIICLLYSNVALLVYHPPTWDRPLDMALIHAPLRFFLALPLNLLFPYCLFVTLGMSFKPTEPGEPKHFSAWHAWAGFAVVMSTNAVALLVVILRRDIVWCVAATWLCVSIWADRPKPAPVNVTTIVFTVVLPLGLIATLIYHQFFTSREGRIALSSQDETLHNGHRTRPAVRTENPGRAREVDAEALWG